MKHPLVTLATYGVLGAVIGILSGFVLSFLIRGLMWLVLEPGFDNEVFQVIHMLGMGVGAAVGGIMGGIVGMKKA